MLSSHEGTPVRPIFMPNDCVLVTPHKRLCLLLPRDLFQATSHVGGLVHLSPAAEFQAKLSELPRLCCVVQIPLARRALGAR